MNYEIKVLRGFEASNYVIMFIRGAVDAAAFHRLFDKLGEAIESFRDCKTLIDFQDSNCLFLRSEIDQMDIKFAKWPSSNRISFVSSPDKDQFEKLTTVSDYLREVHIDVRVFYEMRNAIAWLAQDGESGE